MPQQADQIEALEKAQQAISPEEYSTLLQKIELRSVFLKDIEATRYSDMSGSDNRYSMNEHCVLSNHDSDSAMIEMTYTLDALSSGEKVMKMKATYGVLLHLQEEITGDFFAIYNAYSLPQQTYPYFRELVDSTFTKMGIARLVLPLRKILIESATTEQE